MEERRRRVGQQIQQARRAAGFKSAKKFAESIGISATSVARAEAGWDTTGAAVFADIERGLNWPPGSIADYLEGRIRTFPASPGVKVPMPSEVPARTEFSAEMRAKWRQMSVDEIIERGKEIEESIPDLKQGRLARIRYLRAALQEKEDQLSPQDVPQ